MKARKNEEWHVLIFIPGTQPLELSIGSLEFRAGRRLTLKWRRVPALDYGNLSRELFSTPFLGKEV